MSDLDEVLHGLRMNCDHDAANLIEQQQARITELERMLNKKRNDAELISKKRTENVRELVSIKKERDELTATVELIKHIVVTERDVFPKILDALNATPQQNLNAIKREAFIEGANFGESLQSFDYDIGTDIVIQKQANTKYPSGKDGE